MTFGAIVTSFVSFPVLALLCTLKNAESNPTRSGRRGRGIVCETNLKNLFAHFACEQRYRAPKTHFLFIFFIFRLRQPAVGTGMNDRWSHSAGTSSCRLSPRAHQRAPAVGARITRWLASLVRRLHYLVKCFPLNFGLPEIANLILGVFFTQNSNFGSVRQNCEWDRPSSENAPRNAFRNSTKRTDHANFVKTVSSQKTWTVLRVPKMREKKLAIQR